MADFDSYRARIIDAEQTGNPAVFEELLSDDAVIMPPGMPALEGRDACLEFVTEVLGHMNALYERQVTCDSAEVVVAGNLAFDRGRFAQTMTPRDGGVVESEEGHYLWMYRRDENGRWWLVRIIGSITPEAHFTPIGVVRSDYTDKTQIPKGPGAQHDAEGVLELKAAFEEGLTDIEGFSHLYVIWQFNQLDEEGEPTMMAHPPTSDTPRGVFSTRSPHRPNPIGLTVVKLLGRDGRRLHVLGVDMLDATPILDIKPYLSNVSAEELRRGWMDG
jgi:tRNA-Thr(GGU) m(6)t(6)A37 methyltransferase TsaA